MATEAGRHLTEITHALAIPGVQRVEQCAAPGVRQGRQNRVVILRGGHAMNNG